MDSLKVEVDRNYDWLQRHLTDYLEAHRNQYALLKSQDIVDFFDAPGDAFRAGLSRYADGVFSVQQVTDQPFDLGFLSIAVA